MIHLKDDDFSLCLSHLFIYLFVSFPVTTLSLPLSLATLRFSGNRYRLARALSLSLFMINFRFVVAVAVVVFVFVSVCGCSSSVCFYWFVCNFLFRFINHLIVNQLYTIYFLLVLSICVCGAKTKTICVWSTTKIGIKKRWLEFDPFPFIRINKSFSNFVLFLALFSVCFCLWFGVIFEIFLIL